MKIRDLDIPARAKSCLMSAGYFDIEDILDMSDEELLNIHRNMNSECVEAVREAISELDANVACVKTWERYSIYFIKTKEGILVQNIVLTLNEQELKNVKKKIFVLPEEIEGTCIMGLLPDSLNFLRELRLKAIVLPHTVNIIGDMQSDFYSKFKNVCKRKGIFPKPLIYIVENLYQSYFGYEQFYKKLNSNATPFIYEDDNIGNTDEFLNMKSLLDKNGNWERPMDGLWVGEGILFRYTGKEKNIIIDCKEIRSNVFKKVPVETITFGPNTFMFSRDMIHHCDNLTAVHFETPNRCKWESGMIHDCKNLSNIITCDTPYQEIFEDVSPFYNCPALGDKVVYNRLIVCQKQDEIIVVEDGIKRIHNFAFLSCQNAKLIIVPPSVEIIEEHAFENTNIEYIILLGRYTKWSKKQGCDYTSYNPTHPVYLFIFEDSILSSNVGYFKKSLNMFFKNIERLNFDKTYNADDIDINSKKLLLETCWKNADEKNDEEFIIKPYTWEREIYQK